MIFILKIDLILLYMNKLRIISKKDAFSKMGGETLETCETPILHEVVKIR